MDTTPLALLGLLAALAWATLFAITLFDLRKRK